MSSSRSVPGCAASRPVTASRGAGPPATTPNRWWCPPRSRSRYRTACPPRRRLLHWRRGWTAHYLAYSTYPVQSGDTVLVHAGAGGVGLLLTQLATKLGARVITTVSSDVKEKLSREAGAAEVLRYDDDIAARVREVTDGEGVAVAYDGVGAATFEASLASVRVRGTLALFGASSGLVPPFDPQRLNPAGSLVLTRPTLAHYIRTREELTWRAGEVFAAVADGSLHVRVGAHYPLEHAADAHRDLEARKTTGAVVLVP